MKKIIRKILCDKSADDGAPANATSPSANRPVSSNANERAAANLAVQRNQQQEVMADATPNTLSIALQNKTSSSTVYAYITGLALNNNNAPMFIQSDGRTVYYPASPASPGAALAQDVAIPLGAPGNTVTATIPKIAGGRIWFSVDKRLSFFVNPGPAIVEPSVTNFSDPNINTNWSFAEFTYNDAQLFANITYVDFAGLPVALTLRSTSGATQSAPGMPANGFDTIVSKLKSQAASDGRPWDQLIYSSNGKAIRALSPNNLLVTNANAWGNYWDSYVQQVWSRYTSQDLVVNTQAAAGNLSGRVSNNQLTFPQAGSFAAPSAKDIFSNSTGPFATGDNAARNAVIPRLAAAFNRSTLLLSNTTPNGTNPSQYYTNATTNHYARIVHSVQKDQRGYAFPYDDVVPDGGSDVAGTVMDGSPALFTVAVGGN